MVFMSEVRRWAALAAVAVVLASPSVDAQPAPALQIPDSLEPWVPWVLYDVPDLPCAHVVAGARACTWPGDLVVMAGEKGAQFRMSVWSDAEAWVTLPGSAEHWPRDVRDAGGARIPVSKTAEDKPRVRVRAGAHTITGKLDWPSAPEVLWVAPGTGRVTLEFAGEAVPHPRLDDAGRLWLSGSGGRDDAASSADSLRVSVYRKIHDGVPMRVTTRLELKVSGRTREVSLAHALLPGATQVGVRAGLPVQITGSTMRIYVKPGSHTVNVDSLLTQSPQALASPSQRDKVAEAQEVWVWHPDPKVRAVEIGGLQAVDPDRTSLPSDWHGGSTFLAGPGEKLTLTETRRGEAEPPPNSVRLTRTFWLDVDGEGYTVRDQLTGKLNRGWRLDYNEGTLGRVTQRNEGGDLLITGADGKQGVELRSSALDLQAELRLEDARGDLPIVGWEHDVEHLHATVNLPPGWELLGGTGVDNMPDTWWESWTLFEFFFLLMVSLAIGKLCGWQWAPVAALALVLSHGHGDAPRWVFLHLLASLALLRVLPEGWFRRGVFVYRFIALLVLAVLLAPYARTQVRLALNPQVEHGGPPITTAVETPSFTLDGEFEQTLAEEPMDIPNAAPMENAPMKDLTRNQRMKKLDLGISSGKSKGNADFQQQAKRLQQVDPNAVVQTGPGLPTWQWKQWSLNWTGPVRADHRVSLWLVSPTVNRVLTVLRVLFLILMALALVARRDMTWAKGSFKPDPNTPFWRKIILLLLGALAVGAVSAPDLAYAQGPPPQTLEKLKERLVSAQDCDGPCVVASRATVTVDGLRFTMTADVDAQKRAAWFLPGPADPLRLDKVTVDGVPTTRLRRDRGGLTAVRLEPGAHVVQVEGTLVGRDVVTVHFDGDTRPRQLTFASSDWDVDGLSKTGVPDSSLQLSRRGGGEEGAPSEGAAELPPWYQVQRRVALGLPWQLTTIVTRPDGDRPSLVRLPLVTGERVITEGVRAEDGKALVDFPRGVTSVRYTSELPITPELVLKAPEGEPWSETWAVECSRIWRCAFEGLPALTSVPDGRTYAPEFRPWPGEALTIAINRPEGVEGQAATVDEVTYVATPGKRLLRANLGLHVRASQGGWQTVTLPEGAELQTVTIDGADHNLQMDGQVIKLPIKPGAQRLNLVWQQPWEREIIEEMPPVMLGSTAVNGRLTLNLGADRWLLWTTGPSWGPAILWWSHLVILLLVAVGLGRIRVLSLKTWEWLLLAVGMAQLPFVLLLVPVGWFAMFAWRKARPRESWWQFDLVQLSLVFWTLVSVGVLYGAIHTNLLFDVDMQVTGAGSSNHVLNWYVDRVPETVPAAGIISVPLLVWRISMLLWALWLVARLLKWVPWGWRAFSHEGLFRMWPKPEPPPAPVQPAISPTPDEPAASETPATPKGEASPAEPEAE